MLKNIGEGVLIGIGFVVVFVMGMGAMAWMISDSNDKLNVENNYMRFEARDASVFDKINCDTMLGLLADENFVSYSTEAAVIIQQKSEDCLRQDDPHSYIYSSGKFTWKQIWFFPCAIRVNVHIETVPSVLCIEFGKPMNQLSDFSAAQWKHTILVEDKKRDEISHLEYYGELQQKYSEYLSQEVDGKICWYGVNKTSLDTVLLECGWKE